MPSPSLAILRLQSDERLVALARAGHERAFEAIVERYRRPLLRTSRRYVGEARAEDAVQQALLSAWAALQRGDDVRDLAAWLHRIVHNTALNALRGQRDDYAELRESLLAGGAPHDVLERRLIVRETLETLAGLPERQREALLRVAVEGRSQDEVAESLGLTHGAVRQLVHRARTTLRAAATALIPFPAASWLAAFGTRSEPLVGRIADIAAGTGSAGVGATLAKAGTIAILAGGATAETGLVERDRPPAAAAAVQPGDPGRPNEAGNARDAPSRFGPDDSSGLGSRGSSGPGEQDSSGPGSGGSRRDDSSGPGSGGSDESDSSGPGSGGSRRDDSSGPGSGGSDETDSSGPGSGGSDETDSSGPGSGGSDETNSSGPGSGGSGRDDSSGSSGSGSSGSGSSGPGSSGSGSSGSGSSGSGSSGSGSSGSGSSGSGSSGSGSSGSGGDDEVVVAPPPAVPTDSSSGSSGSGSGGSGSGSSGSGSGGSG